jgi:hypothetical protein
MTFEELKQEGITVGQIRKIKNRIMQEVLDNQDGLINVEKNADEKEAE